MVYEIYHFMFVTGFIGVAVLTSTGQMTLLQAPALANIGTVSMLPNLQNIDLELGALERLVTDLRTSLPTSEDVTGKLDELFLVAKSYVNVQTVDDAKTENIIVKNTEREDTSSEDVSYEDETMTDVDVENVQQTESSGHESEK